VKLRLWILLGLAALAVLASSTPVFRDAHHRDTSTSTFATILRDGYAGWTGFHTCLPEPVPQHDLCWAEMHKGNQYREVELDIDVSQSNPRPTQVDPHDPWTRQPLPISLPEGLGTVNTFVYDWAFLMQNVPATRLPISFTDVNGDASAYPRQMFVFRCTGKPKLITCVNSLGDAIRYTPIKS
jgi:hypothetical protein